jgi:hypothetical protein
MIQEVFQRFKTQLFLKHAKVARENRLKILHESIAPENIPNLEVRLPDSDPKAFRLVLDFIYTDQIDPTKNKKEDANSDEVSELILVVKIDLLDPKVLIEFAGCIGYDACLHALGQISHVKIGTFMSKIYRSYSQSEQRSRCFEQCVGFEPYFN